MIKSYAVNVRLSGSKSKSHDFNAPRQFFVYVFFHLTRFSLRADMSQR